MEKKIEELVRIGFIHVGEWSLNNKDKLVFNVETKSLKTEDIVYAFESEDIVKYIGITEKSLNNRLINYKAGHEENKNCGSTNRRVYYEVKKLLKLKKKVSIYILKGEAECTYYGHRISLSTGIEKSLIALFNFNDNLWNNKGVKSERMSTLKVTKENELIVKLGKEYYNKGLIGFKIEVDHLLPEISEGMDISYQDELITGWFTRSGSNKKVNGYTRLRDIYKRHFNLNENILVTILSENEIKFEKIK